MERFPACNADCTAPSASRRVIPRRARSAHQFRSGAFIPPSSSSRTRAWSTARAAPCSSVSGSPSIRGHPRARARVGTGDDGSNDGSDDGSSDIAMSGVPPEMSAPPRTFSDVRGDILSDPSVASCTTYSDDWPGRFVTPSSPLCSSRSMMRRTWRSDMRTLPASVSTEGHAPVPSSCAWSAMASSSSRPDPRARERSHTADMTLMDKVVPSLRNGGGRLYDTASPLRLGERPGGAGLSSARPAASF